MDKPNSTDPIPPKTVAAFRETISEPLESQLQGYRRALSYLPAGHPLKVFLEGYILRLQLLERGELTQVMSAELGELYEILAAAGVLRPKSDADRYPGIVGDIVNRAGFSYQETSLIMDTATKTRSGPKVAATGMRALMMEMVERKTRREIADALCTTPTKHDHEACIEKFSTQIKRLKKKMKKYASQAAR